MTVWEGLVWAGQACYFSRFLVQWMLSEKAKRSVTPRIFWWLSLSGVLLAGTGAVGQEVWILVPAFVVNGFLYLRNLVLSGSEKPTRLGPIPAATLGLLAAVLLLYFGMDKAPELEEGAEIWILAGILGQCIWGTRFLVQWFLSEKLGKSHFPMGFWWLSVVGAMLNLVYTTWLGKPEFMAAFLIAWFVPVRNLILEYKRRHAGEHT